MLLYFEITQFDVVMIACEYYDHCLIGPTFWNTLDPNS